MAGALVNKSYAQLYCTNQTDLPVWVSVAYNYIDMKQADPKDTWVVEGWLYVEPRDTIVLSEHLGYDGESETIKTNFFYHAYQDAPNGRSWEGIRKFMCDTEPPTNREEFEFRIPRAHKEAIQFKNPTYKWYLFKAGVLGRDNKPAIVTLKQNDVNDTIEGPGSANQFQDLEDKN